MAAEIPNPVGTVRVANEDGPTSQETLHEQLVPRIQGLRAYVEGRIPARFRHLILTDEILQEVWVAAYRTLPTFRPTEPDSIDWWLRTIASSKLTDALRTVRCIKRGVNWRRMRSAAGQLTTYSNLFARFESPQKTPSRNVGANEAAHAVRVALDHLSEPRRKAIELRYIRGLAYEEIAHEMGKSQAAVHGLLYHGLRELRSVLGDAARYFSDCRSNDEGTPGSRP